MFELVVERHFSAAHQLRCYDGPCARVHGHNYKVELSVAGEALQSNGMLLDFGILKQICDGILDGMDHRMLNELPQFAEVNPTSENIARFVFSQAKEALAEHGLAPCYVRVWETPTQSATYRER